MQLPKRNRLTVHDPQERARSACWIHPTRTAFTAGRSLPQSRISGRVSGCLAARRGSSFEPPIEASSSRSLTAQVATEGKPGSSAAKFCFDPIVCSKPASSWTDTCSVSAQSASGLRDGRRPALELCRSPGSVGEVRHPAPCFRENALLGVDRSRRRTPWRRRRPRCWRNSGADSCGHRDLLRSRHATSATADWRSQGPRRGSSCWSSAPEASVSPSLVPAFLAEQQRGC